MPAGEVIAAFVDQELKGLRDRRNSIEARGFAVIATSGVLVTLQMAFLTAVTPDRSIPSTGVRLCVGLSLVGFLTAAALGILVNVPRRLQEADLSTVRAHLADPHWAAEEAAARRAVAEAQISVAEHGSKVNDAKARLLLAAFAAELFGMTMLSVAVVLVLAT